MKKSVVLTGATGVIGAEIEAGLIRRGYRVISLTRNARTDIVNLPKITSYQCDLSCNQSIESVVKRIIEDGNSPVALINCARNIDSLRWSSSFDVDKFKSEINIGVIAPFQLSMAFAEAKESKLKKIINISSIYGQVVPNPNLYEDQNKMPPISYGVTKAALNQLTRELAIRLMRHGIAVNSVAYGGIRGRATNLFEVAYAKISPKNKMMEVADCFGIVDTLLNADDLLTGQLISVDDGWTLC
jgi:NAD(P)-dependent dehydrogenase (short-subunit alcohol dehydrogenase family)